MVENLDEAEGRGSVPAKLVFTDDVTLVHAGAAAAEVVIWHEADLLEALTRERIFADYFTRVLDELELVQEAP